METTKTKTNKQNKKKFKTSLSLFQHGLPARTFLWQQTGKCAITVSQFMKQYPCKKSNSVLAIDTAEHGQTNTLLN